MLNISHPIQISLEEFILTGRFDYLELGMTKAEVLSTFPVPSYWKPNNEADQIWVHGNLEMHFDDDKLFLIFSDYIGQLDGGSMIELDPWVLNREPALTLGEFQVLLSNRRIDFVVSFDTVLSEACLRTTKGGVTLRFEQKHALEPASYSLGGFSLTASRAVREG